MSETSTEISLSGRLASVPCSEIVYRALTAKRFIDRETEEVAPDAFLLRANERGLSVCLGSKCDPDVCGKHLNKRYGVASLHAGRIRDIDLDVEHDPIGPDRIEHALIIKVPYREDDPKMAERFASLLAEQSRIVFRS